jgi:hypothetical protein
MRSDFEGTALRLAQPLDTRCIATADRFLPSVAIEIRNQDVLNVLTHCLMTDYFPSRHTAATQHQREVSRLNSREELVDFPSLRNLPSIGIS